MIWRLFKPRQIVKITIPGQVSPTDHKSILEDLNKRMGKEYVVMLVTSPESIELSIEIIK